MITKKRFKEKSYFPSTIFKILGGLSILLIIIFLIISDLKIYQKRKDLGRRLEGLTQKIQILEAENQKMRAQISRTKTEEYLEEVAFEKLNLKPKGAEVGVIIPIEEKETEEVKKEKTFWEKILDKIGF